jgi:hypothetical protein
VIVWRTGRHRSALWKSLVLPASGAVTCWVLLTTLWMPILDYARSYAPMVSRVQLHIGPARASGCVYALGLTQAQMTALSFHGRYELAFMGSAKPVSQPCSWMIADADKLRRSDLTVPSGWLLSHSVRRRSSNDAETLLIYKSVGF